MAKLLFIAKFVYNNIKNVSIKYKSFRFNCRYHLHISYKNNINFYFRSKLVNKEVTKFKNLIAIYRDNFCYIKKL